MTRKKLISYYHPKKGGLYYAYLVKLGRKWAYLQTISTDQRVRVSIADVREVAQ